MASINGHLPIVQYLVEKEANLEAKNGFDATPLRLASRFGHLTIVHYLVEIGANLEAKNKNKEKAKTKRKKKCPVS